MLKILGLRVVLALAGVALSVPTTFAGTFEIKKGEKNELCRDFKRNLDLHPKLHRRNTSEIPFHPKFKRFQSLRWESLNPEKHLAEIREIVIRHKLRLYTATPKDKERIWAQEKGNVMYRLSKGRVGLGRTRVDIDDDGHVETLYRYGFIQTTAPYPRPHKSFYWMYYVLNSAGKEEIRRQLYAGVWDAFFYAGRIYLAGTGSTLWIAKPHLARTDDEIKGIGIVTVCEFEFSDD